MTPHLVYRALLHCYPAAFRHEYGHQMLLMFTEQLGEARRTGGRLDRAALWIRATVDALTVAPREHWHVLCQDLCYLRRTTAASPGFAIVAILSMALGIGANTAIFSLWNGVLHASLPAVDRPEQLVMLSNPDDRGMWTGRMESRIDGPRSWLTNGEFEDLRDHADVFSGVMASQSSLNTWQVRVAGGAWEEAHGRLVSGGFFQALGVGPAIGRVFTPADDRAGTSSVVISHTYWQRRFGGNPAVLGTPLTLRNGALTIIGVAARGFIGETVGQQPDFWLPLRTQPTVLPGIDRLHDTPPDKVMWLHVFGRLKPGATAAQAEVQANTIFQSGLESFYGAAASGERRREFLDQMLKVSTGARGASASRHHFSSSLTALLAAVGVLLLIACANLATLLLARGAARRPEIALRLSLGASRERIVRQLVTESLALASVGGAAAIAVAYALHGSLVGMLAESDSSFQIGFVLDPRVVAFVQTATLAAGLLFGVLPAWQSTSTDVGATLKEQSRGTIGSLRQIRSGRFLVGLQVALSLPLLVGAGLLARTVYNLQHADLGFPSEQLLLARVDVRDAGDEGARRDGVLRELLGEVRRIPGVGAASFSHLGIFTGGESAESIEVDGYTPRAANDRGSNLDVVGPGYFSALGIPIMLGRDILDSDQAGAPSICVINEAFARRFFEGRSPIGHRITSVSDAAARQAYQVVGVVRNAHTNELRGDVKPRYYLAASQTPTSAGSPTFLIRTAAGSRSVAAAVRSTIERVAPAVPIMYVKPLEDQMAPLTAQDRATAQLAVGFGCVALALAAIGLYGVLSYGVVRRTGDIAVRIALGARPGRVISMIFGETAGVVVAGLAFGGGFAYAASRLIDSQLYGVAPQDPLTLGSATGLLLLVAICAAYLPARRASKLDPIVALRQA